MSRCEVLYAPGVIWVTRDVGHNVSEAAYNIYFQEPSVEVNKVGPIWVSCDVCLDPDEFERVFALVLQPGDGPLPFRVQLERVP